MLSLVAFFEKPLHQGPDYLLIIVTVVKSTQKCVEPPGAALLFNMKMLIEMVVNGGPSSYFYRPLDIVRGVSLLVGC